MRNALGFITPFPGNFDSRLHCLSSRVHRQDHLEAKHLCDVLSEAREDIIVKSSAAQGQSGCLFCQGLDEFWVAMALVDGAVGREKIEVVFAFLFWSQPHSPVARLGNSGLDLQDPKQKHHLLAQRLWEVGDSCGQHIEPLQS
jgi:hypothetical protein